MAFTPKDWKDAPDTTTPISAAALENLEQSVYDAAVADAATAANSGLNAHINDTTDAHDASAISFVPTGTIAATNVQSAIAEVASEAGSGTPITVQDEGTGLTQRGTINFTGAGVTATDDSANGRTNVTIPGGSGLTNPMTTSGDLIVGGTSGTPGRLAKGTDGQVLKVVSGAVAWAADLTGTGGSSPFTVMIQPGVNGVSGNGTDDDTDPIKTLLATIPRGNVTGGTQGCDVFFKTGKYRVRPNEIKFEVESTRVHFEGGAQIVCTTATGSDRILHVAQWNIDLFNPRVTGTGSKGNGTAIAMGPCSATRYPLGTGSSNSGVHGCDLYSPQLSNCDTGLDWGMADTIATSPTGVGTTTATTGGTLAAATYYYRVTVVNTNGMEVGLSSEVSRTTTGTTSTVTVSWTATALSNPQTYRIYRGTASGLQTGFYEVPFGTNTFTDTGAAFTGADGVPGTTGSTGDCSVIGGRISNVKYGIKSRGFVNWVRGCHIQNVQIGLWGTTDRASQRCDLYDCTIADWDTAAVQIDRGGGSTIRDLWMEQRSAKTANDNIILGSASYPAIATRFEGNTNFHPDDSTPELYGVRIVNASHTHIDTLATSESGGIPATAWVREDATNTGVNNVINLITFKSGGATVPAGYDPTKILSKAGTGEVIIREIPAPAGTAPATATMRADSYPDVDYTVWRYKETGTYYAVGRNGGFYVIGQDVGGYPASYVPGNALVTGTGITNGAQNTSGLNTVLNTISADNTRIRLGPGLYDLGFNITYHPGTNRKNFAFEGSGRDRTFLINWSTGDADYEPVSFGGADNIELRNFTAAAWGDVSGGGQGLSGDSCDCIDMDSVRGSLVEDVDVWAARDRAFIFDGQSGTAPATITGITWSNGQMVVTTSAAHGITAGSKVAITGVSPTNFNMNAIAYSVTTSTPFTVTIRDVPSSPGTYTSGGSIQSTTQTYDNILRRCRAIGTRVAAPTSPTAPSATGTGTLASRAYTYRVTYVDKYHRESVSLLLGTVTPSGTQIVRITRPTIPVTDYKCWRIYRASTTNTDFLHVATVFDKTLTTWDDNVPDDTTGVTFNDAGSSTLKPEMTPLPIGTIRSGFWTYNADRIAFMDCEAVDMISGSAKIDRKGSNYIAGGYGVKYDRCRFRGMNGSGITVAGGTNWVIQDCDIINPGTDAAVLAETALGATGGTASGITLAKATTTQDSKQGLIQGNRIVDERPRTRMSYAVSHTVTNGATLSTVVSGNTISGFTTAMFNDTAGATSQVRFRDNRGATTSATYAADAVVDPWISSAIATTATMTITLPDAADRGAGERITVMTTAASPTLTIAASTGDTIRGNASIAAQYGSRTYESDGGTQWVLVAST